MPLHELDRRRPSRGASVSEVVDLLSHRVALWEESLEAHLAGDRSALCRVERQLEELNAAVRRRDHLVAASVLLIQTVLGVESEAPAVPALGDDPTFDEPAPIEAVSRPSTLEASRLTAQGDDQLRHELRLSLALMRGYAQLLVREEAKPSAELGRMAGYIAGVRAQCDALDQLVGRLDPKAGRSDNAS